MHFLSIVFIAYLFSIAPIKIANAASFDCLQASSAIDKVICGDQRLSVLDEQMSRAYMTRRNSLGAEAADSLRSDQRQWLARRVTDCNIPKQGEIPAGDIPEISGCLFKSYQERIASFLTLSVASEEIIDLNKKWKFQTIHGLYDVRGKRQLCVETAEGDFVYWDPAEDIITGPANKNCVIEQGVSLLNTLVVDPAQARVRIHRDTGFGGGATIWQQYDETVMASAKCGPSIVYYFKVVYQNSDEKSFYILSKLKEPTKERRVLSCGDAGGMMTVPSEEFKALSFIESIDMGDGVTLISGGGGDSELVLLRIRSLPDKVWSSDGRVFYVPRELLKPGLQRAGNDDAARYRVLINAIGVSH